MSGVEHPAQCEAFADDLTEHVQIAGRRCCHAADMCAEIDMVDREPVRPIEVQWYADEAPSERR